VDNPVILLDDRVFFGLKFSLILRSITL
jgi:hypothetical protein